MAVPQYLESTLYKVRSKRSSGKISGYGSEMIFVSPQTQGQVSAYGANLYPSYELTQTSPLAISPQLFNSKLKTLLFSKSYPDSSSSPYLPPCLNSKHHPP